ncbi:MAG: membrane dipeptidase [Tepidisphaeraceae bacterium]|jgi:membrane dipeptidase
MFIVDAHLDLSYNALRGRDLTLPASQQKPDDEGTPTVGLPDLHAGGVGLVCATIFIEPASRNAAGGYRSADEAHEQSRRHLQWYNDQVGAGRMRWVRNRAELTSIGQQSDRGAGAPRTPINHGLEARATDGREPVGSAAADAGTPGISPLATNNQQLATTQHSALSTQHSALPFILIMEGADALRSGADVDWWWKQGLRIVGLAWKRTLLAGGTGEPGPLTPLGRTIAAALDRAGFIHDTSHLAEEAFWQLLEMTSGPVMASHSNARAIIPTDRQLSDDMARAIAARGGIIGINLFGRFLVPPEQRGKRPAHLADAVRQVRHFADLFGHVRQIGLGTDLDGGFGREENPCELTTIADLPKLADELSSAGFDDSDITGIMGGNWIGYFGRVLPTE